MLAGSADFKASCKRLICLTADLRLTISVAINMAPSSTKIRRIVIKMVDVSYGGEIGFNQAIELSAETLGSVKLVQEAFTTKVFRRNFAGYWPYCFMVVGDATCTRAGRSGDPYRWENLDIDRIKLRNHAASEDRVLHLSKEQQAHEHYFHTVYLALNLKR